MSQLHICTCVPLFFQFSSRVGRRALSTPRARQWVLFSCLFLMSQCVCQSQPPVLPTPSPFPCGARKFLFHICDSFCSSVVSGAHKSGIGWDGWFWLRVFSAWGCSWCVSMVWSSESLIGWSIHLQWLTSVAFGLSSSCLLARGLSSLLPGHYCGHDSWLLPEQVIEERGRYTPRWNYMT